MALIKCPDCGKMISPRAHVCPECGCPSEYFEQNSNNQFQDDISNSEEYGDYCGKESDNDITQLFSEQDRSSLWDSSEDNEMSDDLENLFSDEYDSFDDDFNIQDEFISQYEIEEQLKEILDSNIADITHDNHKSYDSNEVINNYSITEKQRKKIGKRAEGEVIGIIDTSLMGKGGDGLLFTTEGIAFDYGFEKVFIRYVEIEDISYSNNKKEIILHGDFEGASTNEVRIDNIYYNLEELKMTLQMMIMCARQAELNELVEASNKLDESMFALERALDELEKQYSYD